MDLGFQLVPWRSALHQYLGQHVSGIMMPSGGVEWSFGRKLDLGLWWLSEITISSSLRAAMRPQKFHN
jgi:Protein of unknown function (DUF3363)